MKRRIEGRWSPIEIVGRGEAEKQHELKTKREKDCRELSN
jgi:hypothetical protein